MSEEQNIVKKVCVELGITQKELAENLATFEVSIKKSNFSFSIISTSILSIHFNSIFTPLTIILIIYLGILLLL